MRRAPLLKCLMIPFLLSAALVFSDLKAKEPAAASAPKPVKQKTVKVRKAKKKIAKKKTRLRVPSPSVATLPKGGSAAQARKNRESVQVWLQKMKKSVARSQAKHNQVVAVASVRGNEVPDSPPLYWKGKKTKGPVLLQEIQDFDGALDTALSGDTLAAKSKLEAFLASYPNSSLRNDALHTIEVLGAPEPKP